MYKVINLFADLQDKNHVYNPGDVFPRAGLEVTEARLNELSGSNNKQGKPLIERVGEETPATKPAKKPAKKTTEK